MKSVSILSTVIGAMLGVSLPVFAQTMEPSKLWEVGDKATYTWTLFSKTEKVEE